MKIKSNFGEYQVKFEKYRDDRKGYVIIDSDLIFKLNYKFRYDYVIEATEEAKEYKAVEEIITNVIRAKPEYLVGIGGGVIQDVTAFIASIIHRGIPYKLVPTTLLAQADSCIGSKTCINLGKYKNQIGTFWAPREVIIDSKFLDTLGERDINSGLAEIAKVHILNGEFPNIQNWLAEFKLIKTNLIKHSLEIKKGIIEEDEFDKWTRRILNYGHSFGHALETASNFKFNHGEAVACGINIANYYSYRIGHLSKDLYIRLSVVMEKLYKSCEIDLKLFESALKFDKKNGIFVLIKDLGYPLLYLKYHSNIIKDYFDKEYYNEHEIST